MKVLAAILLSAGMGFAQLGEPANDLGVRLGHVHLIVKDVQAHTRFWTEALGGAFGTHSAQIGLPNAARLADPL